jgi:nuclear pore complex protein Nup188
MLPDFNAFTTVFATLYGRSEGASVRGITHQFWISDWRTGRARRAVFDVARARFPLQSRPLVQLLRAMTAFGFLETDALATSAGGKDSDEQMDEERKACNDHVFFFFQELGTYTQVLPGNPPGGLFERIVDRPDQPPAVGLSYTNTQPLRLPGGSTLPARSIGRVLSADGGEGMLIAWEHKHSGWKFLLEVLTDYVYRRRGDGYRELNFHKTGAAVRVQAVTLDDLGLTEDQEEVEGLVVDALDLIRSVMQDDPGVAGLMMRAMESGDPVVTHTAADVTPPDLVQLTTMILEDALSRSARSATAQTLVTSSMGVLAALLPLPAYSNRVWVYLRASSSLFGTDRAVGASSAILLSDRTRGRYTTTLALLHLVRTLFREASAAALVTAVKTPPLQAMKEEVLLRAARFVHAEIWVEYSSWKYAQVSDRFELGRRVSRFFADVLRFAPPSVPNGAFTALGQAVADAFLFSAAQATIGPLVGALTTGAPQLGALSASRRFGDARRLVFLLEAHLALVRAVLDLKMLAAPGAGACLLEQTLCTRATGGMASSARVRSDPVDAVAAYMRDRRVGPNVPVSALWVLHSLSMLAPSSAAPVVAGHLSDPDGVVTGLSKIIQHPYDDPALRFAAWAFVRQTLDTEPALAAIVVDGGIRVPDGGTNGRLLTTTSTTSVGSAKDADGSTFEIACLMFTEWKELWVVNPRLLCALLDFFAAVWAHGMEHRRTLDTKRADALFWDCIAGVISEELGPTPDYRVERIADGESDLHEGVSTHAYRTLGKAHALTIVALDLDMHFQSAKTDLTNKPASYKSIEKIFKSEDALAEQITEAAANIFDPIIQDEFILQADTQFYALSLVSLQAEVPAAQREFGDNFYFSLPLLERRLEPSARTKALALPAQLLTRRLMSINLNMSMAHAQSELTKSWQSVLRRVTPFLRGDAGVRQSFLGLAATVSTDIGAEARPGPMMAAIHAERLALLLALMEVAWFSSTDGLGEIKAFIALVKNVPPILANPAQYPPTGVVDRTVVPLHRTLLQILYFCARHSRSLLRRPKALNAESRLTVTSMVDATLQFVIGGLRVVFDGAEHGLDLDLDKDMELFVVVFEQCTRTDITSSTASWLGRCAEHDVIGASLRLFSNVDLVGFADLALLQAQGRPLYAQHILAFHMALASLSLPAERLASAGLVHAYSNNLLSVAMRAGSIDATLPELPGMRSPAHIVHCTMLAVLAGVLSSAGRQSPALARDVASFVELHADQVIHALEWTIGDGLTLAKIEEIEQVVHLFHALVESVPGETMAKGDIEPILQEFSQRALLLLQQLNYALTHPNHLASLVEPITVDERAALERDAATSTAGPVDSMKRPFLAQLMHRLFRLSTSLLTTLASIGGAEVVLTGDQDDWPLSRATITPACLLSCRSPNPC